MANLASIVKRQFLHQKLYYWEKSGSLPTGRPAYNDPIELPCRWEDKQQEIILPDKRKIMSSAVLLLINRLLVGSWVFLGAVGSTPFETWQALASYPKIPTVLEGGREVMLVSSTPDIKARSIIYQVYL